jgi:hypothetical protein
MLNFRRTSKTLGLVVRFDSIQFRIKFDVKLYSLNEKILYCGRVNKNFGYKFNLFVMIKK